MIASPGTLLVATPTVYTDKDDEIPALLELLAKTSVAAVVLDLPRGMGSPRRVGYLEEEILGGLEFLEFEAEWDEQRDLSGRKRVVVVARRDGGEPHWGRNLAETILSNAQRFE